MFAVQCSFCQHENTPGARFCAECGSPLHLRVCPNAKCGKVSDVNAAQCEFCGTPFPKIPLAEAGGAGTPPFSDNDDVEPVSEEKSAAAPKASISAWPLIAVAIVAGGLPLLWFNRASLPTPKTWQNSTEVERLIAPPVLPPAAQPSAQAPASGSAAPALGAESLALPPLSAPIQTPTTPEKTESSAAKTPDTVSTAAKVKEETVQEKTKARHEPKPKKSSSQAAGEDSGPAQQQRPCTEAAAALGLCDAK